MYLVSRWVRSVLATFFSVITLTGCTQYRVHERFEELEATHEYADVEEGQLEMHFLGTGGIYLRTPGASLLADPFFSNPPFWRLLPLIRTGSNEEIVKKRMGDLPDRDSLQGILVSHSHYDHAMDIPLIARSYAQGVTVYGNETLKASLGDLGINVQSLAPKVIRSEEQDIDWLELRNGIRVATIEAEHLNHVLLYKYAAGLRPNSDPLPRSLASWREGETYSFVIDIKKGSNSDEIAWRIFFMPSATRGRVGFPPQAMIDERKIDLAIIGSTQLLQAKHYPQDLLRHLRPDAVVLVHWDNFFDSYESFTPSIIALLNPDELARRIALGLPCDIPVYWPQRTSVLRLPIDNPPTRCTP